MMRRIFLCGFYQFPRGSAASNYVQYFSKALLNAGYEVVLISDRNPVEEKYLTLLLNSNPGLKFIPIELGRNKFLHYMQYNYFLGHQIEKILIK